MSLGGIGGGIVLRTKSRDTAYTTDSISEHLGLDSGPRAGVVAQVPLILCRTDFLVAYLAHHNGNSGTLFISSTGLRFAPFISGKKKDKSKDVASTTTTTTADGIPLDIDPSAFSNPVSSGTMQDMQDDDKVVVDGKEVRIPMSEVSGLGKIQKSTLGVTISSGLEIETLSAGVSRMALILVSRARRC